MKKKINKINISFLIKKSAFTVTLPENLDVTLSGLIFVVN